MRPAAYMHDWFNKCYLLFVQAAEAGILRLRTISAAKAKNLKITKGMVTFNLTSAFVSLCAVKTLYFPA